jgi:hypothetical protein
MALLLFRKTNLTSHTAYYVLPERSLMREFHIQDTTHSSWQLDDVFRTHTSQCRLYLTLLVTVYLNWLNNNVTCIPIVRQRLGKHIPARKNRTFIARQQISKHVFLTTEAVFSVVLHKEVIRKCSAEQNSRVGESEESSFGAPACRDMRNWIEWSLRNWQLRNNGKK